MSEIFDKRFVYFLWDDKLKGKDCFVADNMNSLIERIEKGTSIYKVHWSRDTGMPFVSDDLVRYRFAYCDPNYRVKRAYYKEGKKVQVKKTDSFADWVDCNGPLWSEDCSYRVKPEEEKWCVYLARRQADNCYLTACFEYMWEIVQKKYNAKTKLFIGTESEVEGWYEPRQKFAEVIKSWEDGKEIQCRRPGCVEWMLTPNPDWDVGLEYRVKPEVKIAYVHKSVGGYFIDDFIEGSFYQGTIAECRKWIEEHKPKQKTFRPFKDCDELVEFWIKHYQSMRKPMYTKPLIWVRLKVDKRERLIVAFGTDFVEIGNKAKAVPLRKLFDDYEFLDGKPCGKEDKE